MERQQIGNQSPALWGDEACRPRGGNRSEIKAPLRGETKHTAYGAMASRMKPEFKTAFREECGMKKRYGSVLALALVLLLLGPALAHDHLDSGEGYVMYNSYVAPTEDQDGTTGPGTCSVCGAEVEPAEIIPRLSVQRQVSNDAHNGPPSEGPTGETAGTEQTESEAAGAGQEAPAEPSGQEAQDIPSVSESQEAPVLPETQESQEAIPAVPDAAEDTGSQTETPAAPDIPAVPDVPADSGETDPAVSAVPEPSAGDQDAAGSSATSENRTESAVPAVPDTAERQDAAPAVPDVPADSGETDAGVPDVPETTDHRTETEQSASEPEASGAAEEGQQGVIPEVPEETQQEEIPEVPEAADGSGQSVSDQAQTGQTAASGGSADSGQVQSVEPAAAGLQDLSYWGQQQAAGTDTAAASGASGSASGSGSSSGTAKSGSSSGSGKSSGSGSTGTAGSQATVSGRELSGYPVFSERFPWRRLRMIPHVGISVHLAGRRIWPPQEELSPLQTLLESGD